MQRIAARWRSRGSEGSAVALGSVLFSTFPFSTLKEGHSTKARGAICKIVGCGSSTDCEDAAAGAPEPSARGAVVAGNTQ